MTGVNDDPAANVVDLDAHRPVRSPIELVTMRGFGGLALRYRTVVWSGPLEAEGRRVLWGSPWCKTPELAAGAFSELCEVLGGAYDDETGTYVMATVDVNEAGQPLPTGEATP